MKIRMKNMNKIYGLNIDALRLCYEVTEPNNINVIKDKEIEEELSFILEKFPLVRKMLVPISELADKKDKVKTTGNVYNKYYSDLKAAALAYAEQEV